MQFLDFGHTSFSLVDTDNANLTRPAVISRRSAGSHTESAAGNRAQEGNSWEIQTFFYRAKAINRSASDEACWVQSAANLDRTVLDKMKKRHISGRSLSTFPRVDTAAKQVMFGRYQRRCNTIDSFKITITLEWLLGIRNGHHRISSNIALGASLFFFLLFFFSQGGHLIGVGRLIYMRGSNVQSLVKSGSQTSLDSTAFILLHVMQLRCSAGSQIPHCRHRVRGTRIWTCS